MLKTKEDSFRNKVVYRINNTWIGQLLRSFDSFGHPVTLTYKNYSEYRSIFGGVSSLIINLVIFIYGMILLSNTISKADSLVSTSISKVDLTDGSYYSLVLNKDNFDIAYQPSYSGSNPNISPSNVNLYFSMYFQTVE